MLPARPNFWVLLALQTINGLAGFHEDSKAGDAVAALKVLALFNAVPMKQSPHALRPGAAIRMLDVLLIDPIQLSQSVPPRKRALSALVPPL